ncbi:hypothetical protein NHX12_008631 [Muraenolepis orangiensis]|uniref:Uncharacterized protein n=1 Tax=Muraenolepis orangiensis TaxID=630683 RepID=A0A9Q0I887_9TELE|nr:hypothetical protein NHX12_008631 [Muraenolepis orangiensis]
MRWSQVLSVCVVLEDSVDQLAVLGHITYVKQVLSRVVCELRERQVYCSLQQEVEEEAERKAALRDIITRAEDGFRRRDQLQKHLQNVHQQNSQDLKRREQLVALLQDRLQEVRLRTSAEGQYTGSSSQLLLFQTNKVNSRAQSVLENSTALLLAQLEEERRTHQESVTFLKEQQEVGRVSTSP